MGARGIRTASVLVVAALAATGAAAQEAFLEIPGIQGNSLVTGYLEHVEVLEFHHLVTGSGAANHEPVVFVKHRKERSSVDLLQLLDTQSLIQPRFKFVQAFAGGVLRTVVEVRLLDARVVAIEPWSRNDADGSDEHERVRLDYNRFTVVYNEYSPTGTLLDTESHTVVKPQ